MKRIPREVQYFFYSQPFADGIRATLAILLPVFAGIYFNQLELAVTVSLGAMCVSLTDAPGPYIHKRNGMLSCAIIIFLVALVTSFARYNDYTLGLQIAIFCFFFSMFNIYGNRAGTVGNAAILIMIITMDREIDASGILLHASLILGGGLFYTALSLTLYKLRPYRIAQRALGDCIREIATYLSIKADFYNPATALNEDYSKMVSQQIVVHEKQDHVREVLFKTRETVEESSSTGRKLVLTFVESVDLFENITATYYDYALLRQQYAHTGILNKIESLLKKMALELDNMGFAIEANGRYKKMLDYDFEIVQLKKEIDLVESTGTSTQVLKRILVNIRRMLSSYNTIAQYFKSNDLKRSAVNHTHFISHQSFRAGIFLNNLNLDSNVFRHSLRVAIACVAGFIIAKMLSYGHHSYWILLTIAFILKPGFSLTKERNIQRMIGTLAGGAIGVLIFIFIPNETVQFILMVVFMISTYSFMRSNYLVMVLSITPYILIALRFLGVGFIDLASERIIDTIIGCAIAFAASYFLFPLWEVDQFKEHVKNMIRANTMYLLKILKALSGKEVNMVDYKLARKEVYVASANLSAAFQRVLSEPKTKEADKKIMQQFVVFNHVLFSNLASVATAVLSEKTKTYPTELQVPAKRAFRRLYNTLKRIQGTSIYN
ncbi:MAG TPA: FUSC family membrane protein, partial [Flavisolibacter sp.]|nr:FUSC family membrane protein [Flavisolibacter sp.]